MRAVIDHHVDRPDVEAQQCVELTGTNRSIGLISYPSHAAINRLLGRSSERQNDRHNLAASSTRASRSDEGPRIKQNRIFFFDDLVVIARG